MIDSVFHEERGRYAVNLFYDEHTESPRIAYDNVGHMVCFHRRYNLGDDEHYDFPKGKIYCEDTDHHTYGAGRFVDPDHALAVLAEIEKEGGVCLPLYLYDHSGLSISCGKFSCPWDSGQVGMIYCTAEQIAKEWGCDVAQAREYLLGEVETYDFYLRNEVYFYTVTKRGEPVDSCGGYYGFAYAKEAALEALNIYAPEKKLPANAARGGSNHVGHQKGKHVS